MALTHVTPSALDTYSDPDASVVALCERGSVAIEQATTLADARDIKDWADTIEHAAKVRDLNHETIILASALKIRAERRIGQLLQAEPPTPHRRQKGSTAPTLSDLGLSKDQSSQSRRLADPTDDEFDQVLDEAADEAREKAGISRRSVLSKIEERKRDEEEQAEWVRSLGDDPDPEATRLRGIAHRAVLSLIDGVDRLEKQVTPEGLADALATYPDRQTYVRDGIVADVRRAASVIARYKEALR